MVERLEPIGDCKNECVSPKPNAILRGWFHRWNVGQGLAADLRRPPVYEAPPMVAPFSWTGYCIGGHGRWCLGANRMSRCLSAVGATAIDPQAAGSFSSSGFTGGGELGCNYQFNAWLVLGVEGDFEYTGLMTTFRGSSH
jgi:outer membrane immunogenic protein